MLTHTMDEPPTHGDLFDAWRDASRAAQLAERLALVAADLAVRTDLDEEVAELAERGATAAIAAAELARATADEWRQRASVQAATSAEATQVRTELRTAVSLARGAYRADEGEPGLAN